MITKNTDFVGRFYLANSQEDLEPNAVGNQDELTLFIDEFEPKCLVTVLGWALYNELLPELEKLPFNPDATETADEKWINLVNGKANYNGLRPLLVPYIYFNFLENDDSHHTGVGVVIDNPKGAERHPARDKAVRAWRTFYENTVGKNVFPSVVSKRSYVGSIVGIVYGDEDDKYWSLYKFLEENAAVYPTANPSEIRNINTYGI